MFYALRLAYSPCALKQDVDDGWDDAEPAEGDETEGDGGVEVTTADGASIVNAGHYHEAKRKAIKLIVMTSCK